MKNFLVSIFISLLSVGCISFSADSDVILEHNYNLTNVSPVITDILQDCYHPEFSHQFQKLNHRYYNLTWRMVDFQDEIDFGLNSKINHIDLKILNGDDSITISSNIEPTMGGKVILTGMPDNDTKLKQILSTETSQICLTAFGPIEGPLQVHDMIFFHIDLDYGK